MIAQDPNIIALIIITTKNFDQNEDHKLTLKSDVLINYALENE